VSITDEVKTPLVVLIAVFSLWSYRRGVERHRVQLGELSSGRTLVLRILEFVPLAAGATMIAVVAVA
jgi:hypothetical protein